jgi:hypothetical protein
MLQFFKYDLDQVDADFFFSFFSPLRIASGAYYEAHQQLRTIAVRYIKQANYDAAADLLAGGATELLRAGPQQGASASGGDLAIMLVLEVYNKAEWEITGGDSDVEGRSRKSEFSILVPLSLPSPTISMNSDRERLHWTAGLCNKKYR